MDDLHHSTFVDTVFSPRAREVFDATDFNGGYATFHLPHAMSMSVTCGVTDDVLVLRHNIVERITAIGIDSEVTLASVAIRLRSGSPLLVMPHHEYGQLS